jgi:CMP/dCMP kinase
MAGTLYDSSMDESGLPVITIDGPTASGKGAIAHRVADALSFHFLDSGALYRLTALLAGVLNTDIESEFALASVAHRMKPRFVGEAIYLEGVEPLLDQDLSLLIREEKVGSLASKIAALPALRAALLEVQRSFLMAPGLVADGRDMGTVVFPRAQLKIFLTASAEIRAQRRYKQLIEKGFSANLPALLADLHLRDERDTSRAAAPLKAAEDAVLVDSSALTIDEVVKTVLWAWQQRKV